MLIDESFILKGDIHKIWNNLLSPKTLISCIPGCEQLEAIDEKTYEGLVKQKVGPISLTFKFKSTFTEINPPTHLKSVGAGTEIRKIGSFNQETTVDLIELSPGEVEVKYRSNIMVVGKLATFGDRIMRAKVKEAGEQFSQALQKTLQSENT